MANTARLVIDPITRKISTKYEKIRLVQFDNNSERITFEMPRYVRGNDMSKCRCIEVHYDNISLDRKQKNSDIYTVKDLVVAPEDENTINFSWLVSDAVTQLVGTVSFALHFGDAEDVANGFAWHTIPYSGINVYETKHNNGEVVKTYPDVLAKWDYKFDTFAASEAEKFDHFAATEADKFENFAVSEEEKFDQFAASETEKFDDLSEEFDQLKADGVLIDLVHETGDSELKVMSQKAVTEYVKQHTPKVSTRNLANLTFKDALINENTGVYASPFDGITSAAAEEYISVECEKTYVFSWTQSSIVSSIFVYQYDVEKNYLTWSSVNGNTSKAPFEAKLTVGANCAFIRVSFYSTRTEQVWSDLVPANFQIEQGTKATHYVNPICIDPAAIDNEVFYRNVVQNAGEDDKKAMSQKATTELVSDLYDTDIPVGDIINGKFIAKDGLLFGNDESCATDFVAVESGYTFRIEKCKLTNGRSVCTYGYDKKLIECIAENTDDTELTYTVPDGVCYLRATGAVGVPPKITKTNNPINTDIKKLREKCDSQKIEVSQFTGNGTKVVMSQKTTTELVDGLYSKIGEFFTKTEGVNLFDKNQPYETGILIYDGSIVGDNNTRIYTIPVSVGKTYTFPLNYDKIGNYEAYRVCCYNSSKEYIGYAPAGHTDDNKLLSVTIAKDLFESDITAFIKVNVDDMWHAQPAHFDTFMLVEGNVYPNSYIAYEPAKKILNDDVIIPKRTEVVVLHTNPPRLLVSHIAHRTNPKVCTGTGDTDNYRVFVDTYLAFNNNGQNTCALYGLTERPSYDANVGVSRMQYVYRSVDDGVSWEKIGNLPITVTANPDTQGAWYNTFFVDPMNEYFYFVKTTDGYAEQHNQIVSGYFDEKTFYTIGNPLEIGNRRWLSNCNSIDASSDASWANRVVMFGEYGVGLHDEDPIYRIWRTTNGGATWTKCLEIEGDSGALGTGEIRHFHCVQRDPYIAGHWWASAGDENHQCKIFRTTDDGLTWKQILPLSGVEGTQRERTCSFIMEKDCIYYGMDTPTMGEGNVKLFRIDKSKIGAVDDDENPIDPREEVGTVDSGYPVYCLTKIDYPEGFLVWTVFEKSTNNITNRIVVEFYDYITKKLCPVATFDISEAMKAGSDYVGFTGASRYADKFTGTVVVRPHSSMEQAKYGYSTVSRHIKVKVTM